MSFTLPNGSVVSIAASYAASVNITALSNANPGVATATNALAANDIVEITSGWARLNNKVVRVVTPSGTAFSLEGQDTTATATYPAGGGTGAFRKVLTWTALPQIKEVANSGGEQQFVDYQFLESDSARKFPTTKSAADIKFTVADDTTSAGTAWKALVNAADADLAPRAIRIAMPSGAVLYYNGYVTVTKTPTLKVNEIMTLDVMVALLSDPVRY